MLSDYPAVGFHFRVDIGNISQGGADINFKEVSGLDGILGEFTYKEGGENRFVHRLPDRATYSNLVLKRGLLTGSKLIGWFKDAIESFEFDPQDVTVTLLNETHQPLEAWNFIAAYPVKWAVANLNAQNSEVLIETIELRYQYFRRLNL